MNLNNLENLQSEMKTLGFNSELLSQMEEKMKANLPEFNLYDSKLANTGRVDMKLFFKQSSQSDYYYLNKFEVCHQKGQPIKENEQIMILTKLEGKENFTTQSFEQIADAVKFFNDQKQMLSVQKGSSEFLIGKDIDHATKLAIVKDGNLEFVQKEFAQTLGNAAISHSIYVEKGKGFTTEQAVNLIQGRSVYRDDLVSQNGHQYKAWIKLDFDVPKDRFGNFMLNQYNDPAYGFDLPKVLDKFEILELRDPIQLEHLIQNIKNGNRVTATILKNGTEIKLALEAAPRYNQINLYSPEGRPEKREQYLKTANQQTLNQNKGMIQNRSKKQNQGLSV